jgi:hypothetical protein
MGVGTVQRACPLAMPVQTALGSHVSWISHRVAAHAKRPMQPGLVHPFIHIPDPPARTWKR